MNSPQKIHLLPEHIIDQIKAGEVIERPSTLLKEILENSLDAKATEIDIHIVNNGLDLISLTDNGIGISAQELPLAFCRHATSKIKRFEDIYHLHSYGFRGEALASIASISKITCETQTTNTYGLIKIEGGETVTHQEEVKSNLASGTKLFIKELFYNTPVRMKFIQSKTSEKNQLKKVINSFMLLNPEVAFNLKWDDEPKEFFQAYKHNEQEKRISDVFGKKLNLDFFHQSTSYDGVHFEIFLSKQTNRGNAHKNHYLFINERPVQDIQIHKIILNSAAHLWPEGETGHYLAFIRVPADELDVNIHPNKTVIKLFRAPKVYSVISGTIKHIQYPTRLVDIQNENFQHQNFELENNINEKEVSYRSFDFKTSGQLDQYLDQLHISHSDDIPQPQKSDPLIKRFEGLDLINYQQNLIIVHNATLAKFHLHQLFKQTNHCFDTVPLMVSRPIPVTKNINEKNIQFFEQFGFELDRINEQSMLLRSFPKIFQHFPYLKILTENLPKKTAIEHANDLSFECLNDFKFSQEFLFETLKKYSFTELIEEKIIKILSEKNLKDIYDKK